MAAVPPPAGSAQPPPSTPNDASTAPLEPLNWDGDRMFNIYIYDYCWKRGFRKTARELMYEADIPEQAQPPIDAKQGLLFEWWSVFWVLFQAKSTNMPMDNHNAILYNQHQQLTHVRALRAHDGLAPVPGMAENERASAIVMGRPPPTHTSPAAPAGPRGPGQQPNGSGPPHPQMPGSAPQQQPHGPPPPSFNGVPPGQRPMSMNGPQQPQPPNGQQQRPVGTPNHNLPFQSPTMAHSPNMQPGPRPPSQQPPGPGAPMANLGGPSPVMNRGMMPPNGIPQGMVMGGTPQPLQGGPGPQGGNFGHMGGGRPPSRTNTPHMHPGMTQQSPSMTNRQPMPPQDVVESEFRQINPTFFPQLKQDAGIPPDKNHIHFSYDDKRKIIECYKMRSKGPGTPGGPGGPSTPMQHPQQRPPQTQQQQGPPQQMRSVKRSSTSPGEQPESSDSSPPERKRQRRSPMDTTKGGTTPMPYPGTPQSMSAIPPPNQPQGHPQGPPGHLQQQPPPHMMMRPGMGGPPQGQMQINGPIPPPNPNMQMQQQQQRPPGQQQMMGGMQGQIGPQGQMGPPLGMNMGQMGSNYEVPLHQVHNAPGLMQQGTPNAGSPAGPDQGSFTPGGPQGGPPGPGRQQPFGGPKPQGRPNMVPPPPGAVGTPGSMMPPPSPANAAAGLKQEQKDGSVPSPRGPPGQPPNQQGGPSQQSQQGQGPPPPGTPGPQGQQQGQQQQGGQQLSGGPNGGGPTGALVGGGPGMDIMGDPMLFGNPDFNFDLSQGMFSAEGMDFERDFGSWFNPGDSMDPATLDIK